MYTRPVFYPRLTLDIAWSRLLWAAFGGHAGAFLAMENRVIGLSVRTLFDALLTEMALDAGTPVLMSGINIQNMADIVRLHGLEPHFVDLAVGTLLPPGSALLDAQARTGAKLCLVAHLFGTRSPIEGLADLRRRGVCVIEDMAQAFSPAALTEAPQADVTLFSFGPIKRRTALGGALAVFRDPGLAQRVQRRTCAYPPLSDAWFRRRAVKYLLLKALSQPVLYGLVFGLIASVGHDPDAVIGRLARGFSGDDLLRNIRHRPPLRLVALLARQIAEDGDLAGRQRICRDFLAVLPRHLRAGAEAQSHIYWLMPLVVPDPAAFIRVLRRHGFDATRGATSLRALTAPGETAGELMDHIVYLPHPADMDARARSRLRNAILKALA